MKKLLGVCTRKPACATDNRPVRPVQPFSRRQWPRVNTVLRTKILHQYAWFIRPRIHLLTAHTLLFPSHSSYHKQPTKKAEINAVSAKPMHPSHGFAGRPLVFKTTSTVTARYKKRLFKLLNSSQVVDDIRDTHGGWNGRRKRYA